MPQTGSIRSLYDHLSPYDVVIVFNSGGWGDATLAEADDFTPILSGIEDALAGLGYSSVIVPYTRSAPGVRGRLFDVVELIKAFRYTASLQAEDIRTLHDRFPGKKVVITGLSNGGGLTEIVASKIGDPLPVSAVTAGAPWYYRQPGAANLLLLDNHGRDAFSTGRVVPIALAVAAAPFKWLAARFTNPKLSLARAIEIPGHEYPWTSPEVGPVVVDFLESRLAER